MHMTAEQTEKRVQKMTRIFDADKHVSQLIRQDMDDIARDFAPEDKKVMGRMILKLVRSCHTVGEIDDILCGRSGQTKLVRQLDDIAITGAIYVIEDLSKKYVGTIPHLDDFEFMTDEQLGEIAAAIAAGKAAPFETRTSGQMNVHEEEQAADLNGSTCKAPLDLDANSQEGWAKENFWDALFGNEKAQQNRWVPTPYQEFLMNEADGFSMATGNYAYPLAQVGILAEPFKEIVLHMSQEFNTKYTHMPYEKRLSLCQMAEELVDITQTREETVLFFVRPKGQREKILPSIDGLSFHERNFLKDAALYYFQYKDEHPNIFKAGLRKICNWIGKAPSNPPQRTAHNTAPVRVKPNGRERT